MNRLLAALALFVCLTSPQAQAKPKGLPILGFVPEKSYTLGPLTSFDFETNRFVIGFEAVAAKQIYWASLSTRGLFGGRPDLSVTLDLGVNATLINAGLGYHVKTASFEALQDASFSKQVLHGPTLIVAPVIPLADPKSDGRRLFGAVPLLEPYYRLTFFFGEGAAHELGISFRLWWLVRRPE